MAKHASVTEAETFGPTLADAAALRAAVEAGDVDRQREFARRFYWNEKQLEFCRLLLAESARLRDEIATLGDPQARHTQAEAELEILARCRPGLDEAAAFAERLVTARRARDKAWADTCTLPTLRDQLAQTEACFPEMFGTAKADNKVIPFAWFPALCETLGAMGADVENWMNLPRPESDKPRRRIIAAQAMR